jgi:hypothetical protein
MEGCKHNNADYRSIHDGCCSCHISPPCSYCTDQEEYCKDCGEVIEEYSPPTLTESLAAVWKPEPFKPRPCGDGLLTRIALDSSSGSTMEYTGTYEGNVSNADLLKYFGEGSWGYRFGYCQNGRFKFTKITD